MGERRGTLGRDAGQDYEEMSSTSNDLSCSANKIPCSTAGSNSTPTKSLRSSVSAPAGHRTECRRSSEHAGSGRWQANSEMMVTVVEMMRRLPSESAVAGKPAQWRPCIMHLTVSNKCKW
ncbi:unnamed protein product [Arctogadus glacialis]